METGKHWNAVFENRTEENLTWFQADPSLSVSLIRELARPGDAIIDAGGGASRLVDRLLDAGLGPVSVLDISEQALAASQARLGQRAKDVTWIVADVTSWTPDRAYKVWHDRAVFHFLTDTRAQAAYLRVLDRALAPGGAVVIATFADDGPETCSGLPVQRYSPEEMAARIEELAPGNFTPRSARRINHVTPAGNTQRFQVSVFRKT